MTSRYQNITYFMDTNPLWEDVFEERGARSIRHYATAQYRPLTTKQRASLSIDQTIYGPGDRLDKISAQAYGTPIYWWVIARFNQKPTESHFAFGDKVLIPYPLTTILGYYITQ